MDYIGTGFMSGNEIDEMLVDGFTFDCPLQANDSGIDSTLWPMNQQINLSNNVLEQGSLSNGSNQLVINNHATNPNNNIAALQTTYDSAVATNSPVNDEEKVSDDLAQSDLSFNVLLTENVQSKPPDAPRSSSGGIFDLDQLDEVTSMNNVSQNSFGPMSFEDFDLFDDLFTIENELHVGILENANTYPQTSINSVEESPSKVTLSTSPANQILDCSVEDYTIWPMGASSFNSQNHTSPSAIAEEHVPNMIPQIGVDGTSLSTGGDANMIQPNRPNTSQNQVLNMISRTRANEILSSDYDFSVIQPNQPNTSPGNNSGSNHMLMVNQRMRYNEGTSGNQPMGPTNRNHQFGNNMNQQVSRVHQRQIRNGNDIGSSSNRRANISASSLGQPRQVELGAQRLPYDPRLEMFQRLPYDPRVEMFQRHPYDPLLQVQRQQARIQMPQNIPNPMSAFPLVTSYNTPNRRSVSLSIDQYNNNGSSSNLNGAFNSQASLPPLNIGNRQRNHANAAPQSNLANNHRTRSLPPNSDLQRPLRMSDYPATFRDRLIIPSPQELRDSIRLAPPGYTISGESTPEQIRAEHDRVVGNVMVPPPPRGRPEIPVIAMTRDRIRQGGSLYDDFDDGDRARYEMQQARRLQGSPDEISVSSGSAVPGSISPETPQSSFQALQENGIADASNAILCGETSRLPGNNRGKRPMFAPVSITDPMMEQFTLENDPQSEASSPSRTGRNLVYDERYNALDESNKRPRIDKSEHHEKPDEPDKT